jgi:hypothetical protein
VRFRETNEIEPLIRPRYQISDVKTGVPLLCREEVRKLPVYWPYGIRGKDGVNLN